MPITMAMERIDIGKAQTIAKKKGLSPARVRGTHGIQFSKGNEKLETITWAEFEAILKERGLAIYEDSGFMRIMRA